MRIIKNGLLATLALCAGLAFAAPEVNKASAAELDSVKGIGPSLSSRILDERKKGDFKNWADLRARVKGIGDKTAVKFSAEGLTVNGEGYSAPATAKAATAAKPKS